MQPDPHQILEQRLTAEAERRGEAIEVTRDAMLRRGLDDAQTERHARNLTADIVLVVATSTEQHELEVAAKEQGFTFNVRRGRAGDYFQLGQVGANRVVAMRVSMGAFAPDGAAARCIQARAETQATTIILVGTAFGVDPARQEVGNVIVSESVFLYDDRHVLDDEESGTRFKVVHPPTARKVASPTWIDRFQRIAEQDGGDGDTEKIEIGIVLSGGARIESAVYRDGIVAGLPEMGIPIVGGEMEGMGAISAALSTDPTDPGWIIVKGISDFADAPSRAKIEDTRGEAARASARAVLRVLQLPPRL